MSAAIPSSCGAQDAYCACGVRGTEDDCGPTNGDFCEACTDAYVCRACAKVDGKGRRVCAACYDAQCRTCYGIGKTYPPVTGMATCYTSRLCPDCRGNGYPLDGYEPAGLAVPT